MHKNLSVIALAAFAGHILSVESPRNSLITECPVLTKNPWDSKVYGAAPGGNNTFKSQFSSPKNRKTSFGTPVKKRTRKSR